MSSCSPFKNAAKDALTLGLKGSFCTMTFKWHLGLGQPLLTKLELEMKTLLLAGNDDDDDDGDDDGDR